MKNTVAVIGACWGDEGKGKITNYLSEKADIVVRVQGGDNAGHTIVFNGKTFKLHLVPSGIFDPNVKNVLGNGVVCNPKGLMQELSEIRATGFECKNLYISDRATVLFEFHRELDVIHEERLGTRKIGTTKKGIGPAYTDKASRDSIRMCDFVGPDFKELYKDVLTAKNDELVHYGHAPIDFESSYAEYKAIADTIRPMVVDTVTMLNDEYNAGKKILFEGAQGAMLDIDFGTFPYVTSSNTTSGGLCTGSGLGPSKIGEIIGITKAYTTRVGEGPFPTEMLGDEEKLGGEIRERGHEYGATTKRPRRVGWYDAAVMRYSANINAFTGLSLMLLDVLTGIPKIKMCDYYTLDGKKLYAPCARLADYAKCVPHYIELDGWNEDITGITDYDKLPVNCKKYIEKIEEIVGVPVTIVSVGPDKKQTILRNKYFD